MRPLLYLFLTLLALQINAQELCEGTLGDNIFIDGNFGNGTANTVEIDPGIAPGYNYANGVPNDGEYIITNDLGQLFPWVTWIHATDNSDDEDGYFMVINASFEPGIFYEKVVTDLCPNTLYEFSADIINLVATGVEDHIFPDVSFLLNNNELYSTGDVPQNEAWNKYGFSFRTIAGQESLTLTLRNNAPGGGGNDLAIDNIAFRPCGPEAQINLISASSISCSEMEIGEIVANVDQDWFINWQVSEDGVNWKYVDDLENQRVIQHDDYDADTYHYRYLTGLDRESTFNEKCYTSSDVVSIDITKAQYSHGISICNGETYTFGDRELTTPGLYTHLFTSSIGCDSFVLLQLTLRSNPFESLIFETIQPNCLGDMGSIYIDENTGNAPPYEYNLVGEQGENLDLNAIPVGKYIFNVRDSFGCTDFWDFDIIEPNEFIISTIDDRTIFEGDVVQLNLESTSNIDSMVWSPSDLMSCNNCLMPNITPQESTKITVKAFNENGCVSIDSVTLQVIKEDDSFVSVPNIFSPNGDQNNDNFVIEYGGESITQIISIVIFDRYGNLIFKEENPTERISWDGHLNGKTVANGVYIYKIEVGYINDLSKVINGTVSVIK